jgi:peptidoglycan hydrolase CwlO-like protein
MADVTGEIRALQVRVEKLETWAGPGQAVALSTSMQALRADVAEITRVQRQHTGLLSALNRDVSGLKSDVTGLTGQVTGLTGQVTGLTGQVTGLTADVTTLKADVSILKADMTEVKVTLAEILRRLPPPAA